MSDVFNQKFKSKTKFILRFFVHLSAFSIKLITNYLFIRIVFFSDCLHICGIIHIVIVVHQIFIFLEMANSFFDGICPIFEA